MKTRYLKLGRGKLWLGKISFSLTLLLPLASIAADGTTAHLLHSPHIQTLAASCAACHGTNGNSVGGTPVLAGLDKSHFILQMQAFQSGEHASTVMRHNANGLTAEEIEQLAVYFAAQERIQASMPQPASRNIGHITSGLML